VNSAKGAAFARQTKPRVVARIAPAANPNFDLKRMFLSIELFFRSEGPAAFFKATWRYEGDYYLIDAFRAQPDQETSPSRGKPIGSTVSCSSCSPFHMANDGRLDSVSQFLM
jgi:hypothetical protein